MIESPVKAALWVEVDLSRIERNVRATRQVLVGDAMLLVVVKANGYGHGDVEVASAAVRAGADWLGVARVEEGRSLRAAGVDKRILLLAEPPREAIPEALDLGLTPSVYTMGAAQECSSVAQRAGKTWAVHVKVDTGMHRYGVQPSSSQSFFDSVAGHNNLEIEGIWTHFAVAEDVLNPYTKQQYERFQDVLERLGNRVDGLIRHMANSAGIITFPEAHLDMVRAGIITYGIHPSRDLEDRIALEPALTFKSRVGRVARLPAGESISYGQRYVLPKDSFVATIPCGYADGLTRALTNRGKVLIGGNRYTISGTITMDHFMVDLGDDEVDVGAEAVMLGPQGSDEISAHEIAATLDTIPYEVVCAISSRVPRFYTQSQTS